MVLYMISACLQPFSASEDIFQSSEDSIADFLRVHYFESLVGAVGNDVVNSESHHFLHLALSVNCPYENALSVVMCRVHNALVDKEVIHAHRVNIRQLCVGSSRCEVCDESRLYLRIELFHLFQGRIRERRNIAGID